MQLWLQASDDLEDHGSNHGQVLAVIIAIVIFSSVALILRPRGLRICSMACLYVASLVAISLAMCELTRPPLHYRYPAFVTLLHYVCTWAFCFGYWTYRGQPSKCLPGSMGSMRRYLIRIVPIALALPISIALNNKALAHIGAGLAAIVGCLSPVCTAVLSRTFGRRLTVISWCGVLVAFLGALWAGCSELRTIAHRETGASARSKLQGLVLALGALCCRSVRVVLQDSLMSPAAYRSVEGPPSASSLPSAGTGGLRDPGEALSPGEKSGAEGAGEEICGLHMLALQSPAVLVVSAMFAFLTESCSDATRALTVPIVRMLVVTFAIAVCLNVVGACILKELGSTSMQIIGKLNTIVTTAVSMAFFHESLPVAVLCGSAVVLVGVAIFELGEKHPEGVK